MFLGHVYFDNLELWQRLLEKLTKNTKGPVCALINDFIGKLVVRFEWKVHFYKTISPLISLIELLLPLTMASDEGVNLSWLSQFVKRDIGDLTLVKGCLKLIFSLDENLASTTVSKIIIFLTVFLCRNYPWQRISDDF